MQTREEVDADGENPEVMDEDTKLEEVELEVDADADADADLVELQVAAKVHDDEDEVALSGSTQKLMMEAFVGQLPMLVNRDMIDVAATDLVTNLNTKPNCRKLISTLFGVQRTHLDLLPFYS